jgi:hypothetical protein
VFISSVHRYLSDVHCEKMNNPYRSGTADVWYSGNVGDLWIEYKYVPKIPKHAQIIPDLSENQKLWLLSRRAEGRTVFVVVGSPDGAVVIPPDRWLLGVSPAEYMMLIQSRRELADWIRTQTGIRTCISQEMFSSLQKSSLPLTGSSRRRSSSQS